MREYNGSRDWVCWILPQKYLRLSYYYLVQNDVLIVEASNQKLKEAEQTKMIQKISFALTMVTVAATCKIFHQELIFGKPLILICRNR